jgi:hypothetical protein
MEDVHFVPLCDRSSGRVPIEGTKLDLCVVCFGVYALVELSCAYQGFAWLAALQLRRAVFLSSPRHPWSWSRRWSRLSLTRLILQIRLAHLTCTHAFIIISIHFYLRVEHWVPVSRQCQVACFKI